MISYQKPSKTIPHDFKPCTTHRYGGKDDSQIQNHRLLQTKFLIYLLITWMKTIKKDVSGSAQMNGLHLVKKIPSDTPLYQLVGSSISVLNTLTDWFPPLHKILITVAFTSKIPKVLTVLVGFFQFFPILELQQRPRWRLTCGLMYSASPRYHQHT